MQNLIEYIKEKYDYSVIPNEILIDNKLTEETILELLNNIDAWENRCFF